MTLNIDMKMIRPVNYSGFSLIFDMNSWTLLQNCNEVNPGKTFHSNSVGSPSIVSKALYSDELLNHVNLSLMQYLIVGSGAFFQHITQNLKIRKPSLARD